MNRLGFDVKVLWAVKTTVTFWSYWIDGLFCVLQLSEWIISVSHGFVDHSVRSSTVRLQKKLSNGQCRSMRCFLTNVRCLIWYDSCVDLCTSAALTKPCCLTSATGSKSRFTPDYLILIFLFPSSDGLVVFRSFLQTEFSEENLDFWLACEDFKRIKSLSKMASRAKKIFTEYISIQSCKEVRWKGSIYLFKRLIELWMQSCKFLCYH